MKYKVIEKKGHLFLLEDVFGNQSTLDAPFAARLRTGKDLMNEMINLTNLVVEYIQGQYCLLLAGKRDRQSVESAIDCLREKIQSYRTIEEIVRSYK
ncbi:hypothetical protein HY837_05005 [archaeon]|nr:hypothetical protein [archaeon]